MSATRKHSARALYIVFLFFLIIFSARIMPYSAYALDLWSEGFENEDFGQFDSATGTPAIVTTTPHHGTYYMECDASGDYVTEAVADLSAAFFACAIKVSGLPASDIRIFQLRHGTTDIARLQLYNNSGTYQLRLTEYLPSTYVNAYTFTPTLDTWYYVQMKVVVNSADAGEYRAYIGALEVITRTGKDTSSQAHFDSIRIGSIYQTSAPKVVGVDCCAYDDDFISDPFSIQDLQAAISQTITFSYSNSRLQELDRIVSQMITFALSTSRTMEMMRAISLAVTFAFGVVGISNVERLANIVLEITFGTSSMGLWSWAGSDYATRGYVFGGLLLIALVCIPLIILFRRR